MSKADILIKKYGDRRLYNTRSSRYVKLDDIARMVREGLDVQVKDVRTGKDITSVILTQIIVEDARDRQTSLPVQLLQQLVRASDRATHEFLSWYVKNTLDLYQKGQETIRSGFSEAKTAVSNPLDFVRHLLEAQSSRPPAAPDTSDADKLRRRVEELEARLAQLSAPGRRTGKRQRRS